MKQVKIPEPSQYATIEEAVKAFEEGKIVAHVYRDAVSVLHTPTRFHKYGFMYLGDSKNIHSAADSIEVVFSIALNSVNYSVYIFDNLTELLNTMTARNWTFKLQ